MALLLLHVRLALTGQPGAGEDRARPKHHEHRTLLKQHFMDLGTFTGSSLRLVLSLNWIILICPTCPHEASPDLPWCPPPLAPSCSGHSGVLTGVTPALGPVGIKGSVFCKTRARLPHAVIPTSSSAGLLPNRSFCILSLHSQLFRATASLAARLLPAVFILPLHFSY